MMSDRPNQTDQIVTIAVVGDVHDQWEPAADEAALKRLGVDLVLFVGDFGNESLGVVNAIAHLGLPKAAIFGNHDAWYTATDWGRKKCPYDRTQEDWVQQQMMMMGDAHVGFGKLDFPELGLTVVGGRPFSWGGSTWKSKEFYKERFGIANFEQSTARIMEAVKRAAYNTIIFIGHCGPTGLGELPEDPCGKDWQPLGGDHGDPDLQAAIAEARDIGRSVPLVAFGHMHHELRHTKAIRRRSTYVDSSDTVYLNAASVPRIIRTRDDCLRNFSLVTLKNGHVFQTALVWLNQDFAIKAKYVSYQQPFPDPEPELSSCP